MNKKMQMITIDMENYLQALNTGLIKDKKLSGMLNDFLTQYFGSKEDFTDLFLEKQKLTIEIQELRTNLTKKAGELVLIETELDKQQTQKKQQAKKEFEEVERMQKVIKDSNILDEVLR